MDKVVVAYHEGRLAAIRALAKDVLEHFPAKDLDEGEKFIEELKEIEFATNRASNILRMNRADDLSEDA